MFRKHFAFAVLTAALAAPAALYAAPATTIQAVTVKHDPAVPAAKDTLGDQSQLGADLQAAITQRLQQQMSSKGMTLKVRVSKAHFEGGPGTGEPRTLSAVVLIQQSPAQEGSGKGKLVPEKANKAYDLKVKATDSEAALAGSTVISPSNGAYYQAMINSFASYVSTHI